MIAVWGGALTWLGACAQPDPACRAEITAYEDGDGDGFGGAPLGQVCALEPGQVDRALDCDDADPSVHPDARERCNGVDDDCDGEIDDGERTRIWYADADGDGSGGRYPSQIACDAPGDGWVDNDDDCDDGDATIRPGRGEACGGGDEDCDGYLDDADDDVDPATWLTWYRDADGDGAGDPAVQWQACALQPGWVDNPYDCDDTDPTLTFLHFFVDADGDGYGDPSTSVAGCRAQRGRVDNGDDCDDTDPTVHAVASWLEDGDGDGYGAGLPVVTQCQPPGGDLVSSVGGVDCDDVRPDIHPGAHDVCEDGLDQDCDGIDPSCLGPNDIAWAGYAYRTLDDVPPAQAKFTWTDTCQSRSYLPIPVGFELAPEDPDVVAHVVAVSNYATDCILFADGVSYGVQSYNRGGPCGCAGNLCMSQQGNAWIVTSCDRRILIRRPM